MAISSDNVKELRLRTGAGIMDCKKALVETQGDFEKALDYIRKRGMEIAAKKSVRKASEGIIYAYIHPPGKVGTVIELNCESDFVAKTDAFKELSKDLAMHITAMSPCYIKREDIPEDVLKKQREIFREQALNEGKPENIVDKIVDGKIKRFYTEQCLMEQPFIKDPEKTIKELIDEKVAVLGENIVLRRFARFAVGEIEENE